jgi:WD40 repeat protein
VRLWDATTGAWKQTLEGHSDSVKAVAFSPDGKVLASASDDNTVRLWDATTGAWKQTLEGHSHWVNAVAFSPDGKVLASASSDNTVRLWDATTGAWKQTLEGHSAFVNAVAFSPDGKVLASLQQYIRVDFVDMPGVKNTSSQERMNQVMVIVDRFSKQKFWYWPRKVTTT